MQLLLQFAFTGLCFFSSLLGLGGELFRNFSLLLEGSLGVLELIDQLLVQLLLCIESILIKLLSRFVNNLLILLDDFFRDGRDLLVVLIKLLRLLLDHRLHVEMRKLPVIEVHRVRHLALGVPRIEELVTHEDGRRLSARRDVEHLNLLRTVR